MIKKGSKLVTLFVCGLIEAAAPTYSTTARAEVPATFHFEAIRSLDDMRHIIEANYPAGSPREALRRAFVNGSKRAANPRQGGYIVRFADPSRDKVVALSDWITR